MLSGCNQGFKSTSGNSLGGSTEIGLQDPGTGTTPGTGGPSNPPSTDQKWTQVEDQMYGKVGSGLFSGRLAVQIDRQRQSLVILLPFTVGTNFPFSSFYVPQLTGVSLETQWNADGSTTVGVVVPLHYIRKGLSFGDYSRLPNGEPLPGMPVGESKGFAIDLPQTNVNYRLHFYVAVNAVAAYIETTGFKYPPELQFLPTTVFPVKDKTNGRTMGYLGLVPPRGSFPPGVFVSTRIPNELAVIIDDLLKF